MTEERRAVGRKGEAMARAYVERRGVRILAVNYTCAAGEIDLVGAEGAAIVFFEVKTRTSAAFGPAHAAVHFRKQRQIVRTAEWFLAERRLGEIACRFDVLAVTLVSDAEPARVDWIRDAFPAEGVRVW